MTTIPEGLHGYITMIPGQVYQVTTAGIASVQITAGELAGSLYALQAESMSFGPYADEAIIKVSAASGSATYLRTAGHYLELTAEQIAAGAVGAVASDESGEMVDPIGRESGFFPKQHPLMYRPQKVAILGNSHAAAIPGIYDRFCAAMGGAVIRTVNAGIGGNTTAQILARVNEIPNDTDICLLIEGTNDGNAWANTTITLAQHIANMRAIIENLQGRGIRVVLLLGPSGNAPNNTYAYLQMRQSDIVLALEMGIPVYDPYRVIISPTTGGFVSGTNSADGLHAIDSATITVANQLASDLAAGRCASLVPVCNDDRGAHAVGSVRNSLLLTDSNADGLADNWLKSTAGTATLASASADGVAGNWQTISATASASNSWLQLRSTLPRQSSGLDDYYILFAAKFTQTTNAVLQIYVEWYAADDSTLIGAVTLLPQVTATILPFRMSRRITAPSGAAKARFAALMTPSSGSLTGSVSIGEFRLVSIPAALGLV